MEYCAKSELHPASAGLGMLKGRKIFVIGGPFLADTCTREAPVLPPLRAVRFIDRHLGLKPQAESRSPFGTKSC
jgi:hypothetical protein